jgi:hypothetical protein
VPSTATPGADSLFVVGALRVSVRADDLVVGDDFFAEEIAQVYECDGGRWVFASRDGAFAESTGFTGALRRCANERFCIDRCASLGPTQFVDTRREAWWPRLMRRRPHWLLAHAFLATEGHYVLGPVDGSNARHRHLYDARDGAYERTILLPHSFCALYRWDLIGALMFCGSYVKKEPPLWTADFAAFSGLSSGKRFGPGRYFVDPFAAGAPSDVVYDGARSWPFPRASNAGVISTYLATFGPWRAGLFTKIGAVDVRRVVATKLWLELTHVVSGASLRVRIDGRDDADDWDLSSLRWAQDGSLYALSRRRGAGEPLYVLTGAPDEGLTSHRLPSDAYEVAFVDRRRGVAAGATAESLWRTSDGGARWQKVVLPVEGSASRISFLRYWSRGLLTSTSTSPAEQDRGRSGTNTHVDCWDGQCTVARRVLIRGWSESRTPEETVWTP